MTSISNNCEVSRVELLQSTPFFGAVDSESIQFILDRAEFINTTTSEYIFHQFELGDSLYVIESGQLVVFKSWNHQEFILRHLHRGDFFGELALLDYSPRSASVRTESKASLIKISSGVLHSLLEYDQQQYLIIQMNIAREIARRLKAADQRWFELIRQEEQMHNINGQFKESPLELYSPF